MTTEEILDILREADSAARLQDRIGNEGDADAIRRDAIRSILERVAPITNGGSSLQLDMLKTRLQETGKCPVHAVSVAGMVEIVNDLGLDPKTVRIYGGFGDSYLAVVPESTGWST